MINELITLIQTNPAYPVVQCVYGFSDQFSTPPYALILNWKRTPTYDTGGQSFYVHTFDVCLYHKDFPSLECMDKELANVIQGEQLTPETFGLIYEGSNVVQEQLYVFHIDQHYTLYENNPAEHT